MKRKPSLQSLKRKLDRVFSRFIRSRDANEEGMGFCVSCGQWSRLQAGHFIKRQYWGKLLLRVNPLNVAGQCAHCNAWGDAATGAYFYRELCRRHGKSKIQELFESQHSETPKLTRELIESLIKKYESH